MWWKHIVYSYQKPVFLRCRRTGETAQCVNAVATKPDAHSGIPRMRKPTHKRFSELYTCMVAQAYTPRQLSKHNWNAFYNNTF